MIVQTGTKGENGILNGRYLMETLFIPQNSTKKSLLIAVLLNNDKVLKCYKMHNLVTLEVIIMYGQKLLQFWMEAWVCDHQLQVYINYVAWVHKRLPLVGEVSANLYG
jgi:hypothetical protein